MSSPPVILELNFEKSWRGGERQTLYNILGFRDVGLEVHLLCRTETPLHHAAIQNNIPVHAFQNIFGALFFLLFRARRFGVLHAQTSHILTYCVFTRPFHRAKIIFTRRVDFVPKGFFTRLKYRLTQHLVGISRAVQRIMESFAQRPVTVISDAAVVRTLDKTRTQKWLADIPEGAKIIGTTAAFVPHKDPLTMVAAIAELAKMRQDFVFLHFGDGPLLPDVQAQIALHKLEAHYRLKGFQKDVEDVFSVLDVFAMSSNEEGLGSSVLDAFLYRVPVVATNAGGLVDLLEEGRGVLCEKNNPVSLANGLNTLLNDTAFQQKTTEAAYEYATTHHSIPFITEQYLALIKDSQ